MYPSPSQNLFVAKDLCLRHSLPCRTGREGPPNFSNDLPRSLNRKRGQKACRMMRICFILVYLYLGQKYVQGALQKLQNCNGQNINVVSFVNPDLEIGSFKKSLDDIPSLALLANDPRATLPESYTICSDIMTVFSSRMNFLMFFNLLGSDGEQLLPAVTFGEILYTTRVASGQIPTIFPNQWVRSCMAIDTVSGMINWVIDGNLIENNTIPVLKGSKTHVNLNRKIILGAYQEPTKSWQVFSNKLTNLNIFSGILSLPVMQRRTRGEEFCLEEGSYLAWSEMRWELQGTATIEQIRPEELDTKPMLNLYSAQFLKRDCKHFCENLGTQTPSVSSYDLLGRLQDFCAERMKGMSRRVWLAVDDENEEGVWTDTFTGQPLNYKPPWVGSEPDGGTKENCAGFFGCRWFDVPCTRTDYCLCESQPRPKLKLLGLCKETMIDHNYQPQNDGKDIETLVIVGQSTLIKYDHNQRLWLINVVHSNVTGTSVAFHKSFTLGRNTWIIVGDKGCNEMGNTYTTELKMSGCKDGSFTCYDGQCVSMERRCDQVPNCRDHSDERGCFILVLEEGYNKRVPPVTKIREEKNKIAKMGEMTSATVIVSLTLIKVAAIQEEDHSIELQFQITLEWKEIRATFYNLKPQTYLNALSGDEIDSLWLPLVIYTNTDQQQTTRLGVKWEWYTDVSVKREGNFTRSGYDLVDETEIFKGEENTLIMTQSYTHKFQCIYQLGRYPFDTQVRICFILSL